MLYAAPMSIELNALERLFMYSSWLNLLRITGLDREGKVAGTHQFLRKPRASVLE